MSAEGNHLLCSQTPSVKHMLLLRVSTLHHNQHSNDPTPTRHVRAPCCGPRILQGTAFPLRVDEPQRRHLSCEGRFLWGLCYLADLLWHPQHLALQLHLCLPLHSTSTEQSGRKHQISKHKHKVLRVKQR